MEKPAAFSLRSDFDLLGIKVTDDPKTIKEAYNRLLKSQMHKKNYGNSDERAAAENWLNTCTPLANGKAGPLVEAILQQAAQETHQTLLASEGKTLSEALRASLLETLTTRFNIELRLADRFLTQYLEKNGYKVGKPLRVPIAPARPVEELRAVPDPEGVRLTWKLPESDCDGIVLVRNAGRPPRSYTDGDVLEKGKSRTHLDCSAKPGETYHYTVFSVFKGEPAESGPTCAGYRTPAGVSALQGQYQHPCVRLSWRAPSGCRAVWIFRTPGPATVTFVNGRPVLPAGGITPGQFANQITEYSDNAIDPMGGLYYYHAVAQHAAEQFSAPESVAVRVPPPLTVPRVRHARAVPGRIALEWEPAGPGPVVYRLTRRGRVATTGIEETIYEGPATGADDSRIVPGMTYWYSLFTVDESRQSAPARFSPVVAVGEVQSLQVVPSSGAVELKWCAPPGVLRVVVRRGEVTPPAGLRHGVEITGAGKLGVTDRTVVVGRTYAYRIGCVFKDPEGHEIVTPGITTLACGPYNLPAPPTTVRATMHDDTVSIAWEPSPTDITVFRHAEDIALRPDAPVPLGDLEGGARRLRAEGGTVRDRFDPSQPWYLLTNVVGSSVAVVRYRVRLLDLALRYERRADQVILNWVWPQGLERMVLTRESRDEHGDAVPAASVSWTLSRAASSVEGEYVDKFGDSGRTRTYSYRLEPATTGDKAVQVLVHGTANRCDVSVGRVAWIHYRVRTRRKWLLFTRRELVLRVRDWIEDFPGIRLDAITDPPQPDAPADGSAVLTWPSSPRDVGPGEYVVPIPTRRGQPAQARLRLIAQPPDCDVRLRPIGDGSTLRLK